MIEPQKTSEALSPLDGCGGAFRLVGDCEQQEIIFSLVVSLAMEVLDELRQRTPVALKMNKEQDVVGH